MIFRMSGRGIRVYELSNIITVSVSEARDYRTANGYGYRSVDLAAPGTSILSTWVDQTYKLGTSPSSAAAHVAGASALVWSQNPTLNWKKIKGLILNGAEDGLHGDFYWGDNMTEGRLNLANSLSAAVSGDPAIFAINPQTTNQNQPITLTGINFGSTKGTITFYGYNCTYIIPPVPL